MPGCEQRRCARAEVEANQQTGAEQRDFSESLRSNRHNAEWPHSGLIQVRCPLCALRGDDVVQRWLTASTADCATYYVP